MKLLWSVITAVGLGIVFCGCHTTEANFAHIINEPMPVAPEVRESFGVMGVLPMDTAAEVKFPRVTNMGQAAEKISGNMFGHLADSIMEDDDMDFDDKMGALAFSAILSGATGMLGALFTGVPESDMRRAEQRIQEALRDQPLEAGIGNHLNQIIAVLRRTNYVASADLAAWRLTDVELALGDFRVLTNSGIDSVLVVRVVQQGFNTKRISNKALPVDITVGIDVVRVADGERLFSDQLRYQGERHPFTKWGANKAKLFRSELETAQVTFAAVIFEELEGDLDE